MSVLLIGRWEGGAEADLVITESHTVEDGDQARIDALVAPHEDDGALWWCELLVDRHSDAVQMAYETYVRDEGVQLVDEAEGFEPHALGES
ncbi:hypothetical protein ACGRHY_29125 [Streptomyces sp. HK10]|uniref:hypothetical protein n=1 Tax=Streptomyces sp. HK10 TaxID=3373255 RepID=UPI003749595B